MLLGVVVKGEASGVVFSILQGVGGGGGLGGGGGGGGGEG
jgi:hypothetical protein